MRYRPDFLPAFLISLLLLPAPAASGGERWFSQQEIIMGTVVRVEVEHADERVAQSAMAAVMEEMRRIDRLMSPYKEESELSRVNREAASGWVAVSEDTYKVVARSLEYSKLTRGAFDITFSSVGYLYDYQAGKSPTDEEVAAHLAAINYRHVQLDKGRRAIRFSRAGVRIDLGGIAKGYAVDNGIEILRKRGIERALVNAGGDSRLLGDHDGRPWMIGIRDPRQRGGVVTALPLVNAAISTSGDYERYFEREGVRHHHILNPRTGRSAGGMRSASIIGPDGITTDALSTSVFVLGVSEGLKLIASLPGIEALLIDSEGRMHATPGLRPLLSESAAIPPPYESRP